MAEAAEIQNIQQEEGIRAQKATLEELSTIRAAQAVKLLGAQAMITGIRPEVAQTLIGLGVDLSEVITYSSLQIGVARAIATQL